MPAPVRTGSKMATLMSVCSADLPLPGGAIQLDVSPNATTPLISQCFGAVVLHSSKNVSLRASPSFDLPLLFPELSGNILTLLSRELP